MKRFIIHDTPISGLQLIERKPICDERGFLERLFCQESIGTIFGRKTVRQINHTLTRKLGAVRGMHFQSPPHAEVKIVTCLKGRVWDVAIDLRRGSPTFLRHHAVTLSENVPQSYLIPEGFAHGFQALSADCELIYIHSGDYEANAEGGLNALDPYLNINWPLAVSERSQRDEQHAMLTANFIGVEVT